MLYTCNHPQAVLQAGACSYGYGKYYKLRADIQLVYDTKLMASRHGFTAKSVMTSSLERSVHIFRHCILVLKLL